MATINGWYPIQKIPNVFGDRTGYPYLLRKHRQITLCVASSRHRPVDLAICINIRSLDGRVYAHDGLLPMLRVTSLTSVTATAIERGGNGFKVDGDGDGKERRLRRGCCAYKDWEAAWL